MRAGDDGEVVVHFGILDGTAGSTLDKVLVAGNVEQRTAVGAEE